MSIAGHFWTIVPHIRRRIGDSSAIASENWFFEAPDERYGTVELLGRYAGPRDANELLLVVHGLGGSSESGYAVVAASAAAQAKVASLRLNLRGADKRGEDIHHAGLWQDVDTVLADPRCAQFRAIYLLGYSLGGQLCLHWAAKCRGRVRNVRAVASVCAPLDLASTAANLDAPRCLFYRRHVISGLRAAYREVAAKRSVPVSLPTAERITRIIDWDEKITAPRFGFAGAAEYYAEASAGPILSQIGVRTLVVVAEDDPMVPLSTVEPSLRGVSEKVTIQRVARGGHVGFPANTSLDQAGALGLEPQIIAWLRSKQLQIEVATPCRQGRPRGARGAYSGR